MSIVFEDVIDEVYNGKFPRGQLLVIDDLVTSGDFVLGGICRYIRDHCKEELATISADFSHNVRQGRWTPCKDFGGKLKSFNVAPSIKDMSRLAHYTKAFSDLIKYIDSSEKRAIVIVRGIEAVSLCAPQRVLLSLINSVLGAIDKNLGALVIQLTLNCRGGVEGLDNFSANLTHLSDLVIRVAPLKTGATQLASGKVEIYRGGVKLRDDDGAAGFDKRLSMIIECGPKEVTKVLRKGYATGTL